MGSINLDISRYEVSGVYTHPDAKVDVVLVHGLNGDPRRSWTAKNDVYWPADLLPATLKDRHANVLVYGYNADVYSRSNEGGATDNFLFQHAQTLVTHLTIYRKSEGTTANPIIWVAHSLGGILVKRALLYSNDLRAPHHEEYRSIFVSTYAIIFLGTPHTGSGMAAWGHVLQAMSDAVIPRKIFDTESVLLKALKRNSERLQEINNHFLDVYQRFKIHMAHENHKTDFRTTRALVVDVDSASPQLPGVTYYGIEATHSAMSKFDSVNAPGYRIVSTAIREWVAEAPPVIEVRWGIEEEDRQARARQEINERQMPFISSPTLPSNGLSHPPADQSDVPPDGSGEGAVATSPMPLVSVFARPGLAGEAQQPDPRVGTDPPFFHPEPFRPNSYFVGREAEMKDLHRKLMDRGRRAEGTSAVLLQCLPGGGKTHLARQYLFRHRADYGGGVYWVRAKSITEMEQFYWRIARAEVLRDSIAKIAQEHSLNLYNPRHLVDIVRRWFNSFENWLLVFDGIRFDMFEVQRFIPDAKNTSIIYTSTERAVSGHYEFDNPQIMELGLLSARESQELLLTEMEKKQPWTQDDRSRAIELAHLVGRLPLMIHVAAQHLKATREPLSKYLRGYRNRPKVGRLPAYRAVWDQLKSRGANAALNLMSILVFYDQHVPVGMLSLGLGALDNRTPILTKDASHKVKSLNNTLRVLIAFALVERTETDNISPTSSRSSKSFEPTTEFIDILRIHSVVQAFFLETLTEEKEYHFWLERSASVFCQSLDEANRKIEEDPKVGLPDDYRRFAMHGRKLLEHLKRHEKGGPEYLLLALKDVEERLSHVQQAVNRLSHAAQRRTASGSAEVAPTSVFERASSLSETDSATPSSHRSLTSTDNWTSVVDGDVPQFQSPTSYGPRDYNPYHFHVPYPHRGTIPVPPFASEGHDDDHSTEVPTPRHASPRNSYEAGSPLAAPASDDGWRMVGPSHRTVKKSDIRRYHDRAGAWRNQGVGDPRISVSREIARGSISRAGGESRSPARAKLTSESEAELTLTEIKKTAPPSPRAGGLAHEISRLNSSPAARPRFIVGRNSYADVLAGKTPETACAMLPTELSSGLSKASSPPSSWTAATLKRLKENIISSRTKSADQARKKVQEVPGVVPPGRQLDVEASSGRMGSPPTPMFRGSRTANSSPGPVNGTFPSPGDDDTGNLRQALPASIRQWKTQVYHPGHGYIDSSELMALSYPDINVHPPAMPDGYTSEPMTRDASAQPSHDSGVARGGPSGWRRSSPLSAQPQYGLPHGQPVPITYPPRSPSVVQTEPSPHVPDAFPGVDTSYQRWEERYGTGRRRAGSGSQYAGSPVTARQIARGEGRSQSQSPSGGGRGGRWPAPINFQAPVASPESGQSVARSGSSGGFRLKDGRIIEFGEIVVDINRAHHWATQKPRERDERAVSPDGSDDAEGLGLGITQ